METPQLWEVFQLCEPDPDGRIRVQKLAELFEENSAAGLIDTSKKQDEFLTFEQFCAAVQSFAEEKMTSVDDDVFGIHQGSSGPTLPNNSLADQRQDIVNTTTTQTSTLISFDDDFPDYPNPENPFGGQDILIPSLIPDQNSLMTSMDTSNNGRQDSPSSLVDSALGGMGSTGSPDHGMGSTGSPDHDIQITKSACSSLSDDREENFESYGENDDIEYEPDDAEEDSRKSSPLPDRGFVRRNSWMRTSLRRSPASNADQLVAPRRWGSFRHSTKRVGVNAKASALFHNGNSSFNSSGRSSNCDEAEINDMHSDISLEEDVIDLNHKVHLLQQQVGHLAESQQSTDDRYSKVKQDNAQLTARIHMLEQTIQELELRNAERLDEEKKRNKEILVRLEREKQLEIENYAIRLQTVEREHSALSQETVQLRSQLERLKHEKESTEEQLTETQQALQILQGDFSKVQENAKLKEEQLQEERQASSHIIEELSKEVETLREDASRSTHPHNGVGRQASEEEGSFTAELSGRIAELEREIRALRDQNRTLTESNEDLYAKMINRGLDEGQKLITNHSDHSLAQELEDMDESKEMSDPTLELTQIRNALKEQQDVNKQLRNYIDGILMNIIEKYPELLEVRK